MTTRMTMDSNCMSVCLLDPALPASATHVFMYALMRCYVGHYSLNHGWHPDSWHIWSYLEAVPFSHSYHNGSGSNDSFMISSRQMGPSGSIRVDALNHLARQMSFYAFDAFVRFVFYKIQSLVSSHHSIPLACHQVTKCCSPPFFLPLPSQSLLFSEKNPKRERQAEWVFLVCNALVQRIVVFL